MDVLSPQFTENLELIGLGLWSYLWMFIKYLQIWRPQKWHEVMLWGILYCGYLYSSLYSFWNWTRFDGKIWYEKLANCCHMPFLHTWWHILGKTACTCRPSESTLGVGIGLATQRAKQMSCTSSMALQEVNLKKLWVCRVLFQVDSGWFWMIFFRSWNKARKPHGRMLHPQTCLEFGRVTLTGQHHEATWIPSKAKLKRNGFISLKRHIPKQKWDPKWEVCFYKMGVCTVSGLVILHGVACQTRIVPQTI